MTDPSGTNQELLEENSFLKQKVREMEKSLSAHRHEEEALSKSEKLYRSLFEHMLNGLAYCQMHWDDNENPCDFTYLSVNNAFETLTGLSNVVGKKVSEVIPGIRESDRALLEIYGRVSKTGKPERFEMFVASLQMWFSVSVYSNEIGYFVAVFDVITERKQAEAVLRESEARFRRLFENIHVIGLVIDPADGSIVDANPAATSFYGWSRDELRRKNITQINTLSREEIFKEMGAARQEHRYYFLFQHRRADNSVRDVEVYSGPVRTGTKELLYSIIHDVTERKRAEDELRLTSAKLRTFMDAINESAFLVDRGGRILAANETVAKRFNRTVQELIGARIEDFFSADPILKRQQYLDEVVSTGKSVRFEDERLGRTIDNVIYPVLDPQGEVLALAVIGYDITERKKIEKALEEERKRLQLTLAEVRTLHGIVPICANCKKIRDDKGFWNQVEVYIRDHTEAEFSHGICPECMKILYPKFASDVPEDSRNGQ